MKRVSFSPSHSAAAIRKKAVPAIAWTSVQLLVLAIIAAAGLAVLVIDPAKVLTAALALVALTLIMARAENGALLVILLLPLMDFYVLPLFGVNFKVSDWAAMLAIVLFLARLPFDRSLQAAPDPLRRPMVGYILFGIVSSVLMAGHVPHNQALGNASGLNGPVLRTWTQAFWALYSMMLYYMIYRVVRTKRILKWCVGALLFASVLVALYAISGQRYWTGGGYRVLGTFSEPSYYAEWLVLVLPLAIALTLANQIKPGRIIQIPMVLLLLINLALTFSTGGFASGAVALTLVMVLSVKVGLLRGIKTKTLIAGIGAVILMTVVAVIVAVPSVQSELHNLITKVVNPQSSEHSAMVRERARFAAKMMWLEHPVWGIGPGNYPFFRNKFIKDDPNANLYEIALRWDPQCLYYEVLSERGLVGMAFFVWLWAAFFIAMVRGLKEAQDDFTRAVLAALFSSAAGILVGYWAHANFFRIYVWVLLGLGMAAVRLAREPVPAKTIISPGIDEASDTGRLRYSFPRNRIGWRPGGIR